MASSLPPASPSASSSRGREVVRLLLMMQLLLMQLGVLMVRWELTERRWRPTSSAVEVGAAVVR